MRAREYIHTHKHAHTHTLRVCVNLVLLQGSSVRPHTLVAQGLKLLVYGALSSSPGTIAGQVMTAEDKTLRLY
jgi:hypothetical protein